MLGGMQFFLSCCEQVPLSAAQHAPEQKPSAHLPPPRQFVAAPGQASLATPSLHAPVSGLQHAPVGTAHVIWLHTRWLNQVPMHCDRATRSLQRPSSGMQHAPTCGGSGMHVDPSHVALGLNSPPMHAAGRTLWQVAVEVLLMQHAPCVACWQHHTT